ncbi:CLUMA_CG009443, isoform A [Clunio marinus]|uniref:CLUMA_CG009443, isoform A n=1 Tax=Clunio marinus TaxID=568069 RepID=A0A1J1I742_9DIPT|nr:CLUMA_CG009443, isoform A [Clunio marinus]
MKILKYGKLKTIECIVTIITGLDFFCLTFYGHSINKRRDKNQFNAILKATCEKTFKIPNY